MKRPQISLLNSKLLRELEETEQLTTKEGPQSSPLGLWLHKKRILNQKLKAAVKTSQQDDALETKVNPSQVSGNVEQERDGK